MRKSTEIMGEDLMHKDRKKYVEPQEVCDFVCDSQIPLFFPSHNSDERDSLRVLSLFSGCGGMDLGFEGDFIAHKLSFAENDPNIITHDSSDWIKTRKTKFKTIFANDILPEAQVAWTTYMQRFGYGEEIFCNNSIVEEG